MRHYRESGLWVLRNSLVIQRPRGSVSMVHAQVLLWQLEPTSYLAVLRHTISCLSFFVLTQWDDRSHSFSLSCFHLFVHLAGKHSSPRFVFSCSSHLSVLSCFISPPHFYEHTLESIFKIFFANPPAVIFSLCVHVGGRGNSSLHPTGSASDSTALQAGGESRQERFPVP